MRVLKKIPGRQYYVSIFIIGAALFVTFSTVIYRRYDEAQRLSNWALYNYEVNRQSRLLMLDLLDMETGVRGYLLSGKRHFLQPYNVAIKNLPLQIKRLRELTKNDQNSTEEINSWLKQMEDFENILIAQLKQYNEGHWNKVSPSVLERQKYRMDKLRDMLEDHIKRRLDRLQVQIDASKLEQRNFLYIMIIGTVLAVGAMLMGTLVILALAARSQTAAQEIAAAEERLITVMNGLNDGVYDLNPQTGVIHYSPALKTMLGYSNAEFPNTLESFNSILHPEDAEATWAALGRYERREVDHYTNILRMRHKNGSWRWILSRAVGFWDKGGRLNRLIGMHTDITEQKKREEQLGQLNSEMETFTYIASHDLRSPLVNLKGFAREIQHSMDTVKPVIEKVTRGLSDADQQVLKRAFDADIPEALRFIEKATQRMDTLTTAMLDLSRIGRREYVQERVDVQAIVNKCLDAQAYEISNKAVTVECAKLPWVSSDPLALEQVFSNLLDNAVKYLDPKRPGRISIGSQEAATDVVFSVADNGRGIGENDKQKVFEIFKRARNTEDVRGIGMGMAFVKATMHKLGGSIWFDSKLGEGSSFYLRLPKETKGEIL